MKRPLGILLTNTGTPDSPAVHDVRAYLKAFLSDPRVVRLPKILWKPLLHTVILRLRAPYSAQLYQKIWTAQGSPLRAATLALSADLENYLAAQLNRPVCVAVGMHYGNPSIPQAIAELRAKHIDRLIVLPLFPQYSTSTTATAHDQVTHSLKSSPELAFSFIEQYAAHPSYIAALTHQIEKYHDKNRYLLFSFHGLPQRFVDQGDPYPEHCQQTARLVAQSLALSKEAWSVAYQSRFGYAQWLAPYTFATLQQLAQRGIRQVSVVCPGFSVDCLETLEEIQIRGRTIFLQHGGEDFHYIPALNTEEVHIKALAELLTAPSEAFLKPLQ